MLGPSWQATRKRAQGCWQSTLLKFTNECNVIPERRRDGTVARLNRESNVLYEARKRLERGEPGPHQGLDRSLFPRSLGRVSASHLQSGPRVRGAQQMGRLHPGAVETSCPRSSRFHAALCSALDPNMPSLSLLSAWSEGDQGGRTGACVIVDAMALLFGTWRGIGRTLRRWRGQRRTTWMSTGQAEQRVD